MRWYKDFDDNDNTIYSASSVYHDDGSHLQWRVTQVLEDNKILWTVKESDGDVIDEFSLENLRWKTADAAKKWIGRQETAVIKSIKNAEY